MAQLSTGYARCAYYCVRHLLNGIGFLLDLTAQVFIAGVACILDEQHGGMQQTGSSTRLRFEISRQLQRFVVTSELNAFNASDGHSVGQLHRSSYSTAIRTALDLLRFPLKARKYRSCCKLTAHVNFGPSRPLVTSLPAYLPIDIPCQWQRCTKQIPSCCFLKVQHKYILINQILLHDVQPNHSLNA